MIGWLLGIAGSLKSRLERARTARRWARLQAMGMHIGHDVLLPASTWIDDSHCFLISIGDHCGFGDGCLILAHDAQMDEYLDAARIGRVIIHPSCHIGARTIILAGVEIGPRTIVGAGSVVSRTLPANTVCAGNPAKVICTLDEYLDKHRRRLQEAPTFDYRTFDVSVITPDQKAAMIAAITARDGYMTGGRTAELQGTSGTVRTTRRVD